MVSAAEVLLEGVVFGESPRWHDGRLWFSDWGAGQVIALDAGGGHQVMASVASFPMCIDFLPDGRLLVVDSARRRLLRREPDGALAPHADLSRVLRAGRGVLSARTRRRTAIGPAGPGPGTLALATGRSAAAALRGSLGLT
jgi:sugar lactone lactonase YvrE